MIEIGKETSCFNVIFMANNREKNSNDYLKKRLIKKD